MSWKTLFGLVAIMYAARKIFALTVPVMSGLSLYPRLHIYTHTRAQKKVVKEAFFFFEESRSLT